MSISLLYAVTDAVTDTVTDAVYRTSQPLRPRSKDSNGRPLSRRGRESSVSYYSAHSEINIRELCQCLTKEDPCNGVLFVFDLILILQSIVIGVTTLFACY